jgi:hypothetical protein
MYLKIIGCTMNIVPIILLYMCFKYLLSSYAICRRNSCFSYYAYRY